MKLKLAEHVEDYGIALDAFAPKTVQGLLLSGYVSLIEVSPPEFASSRQEIIDLSKLIVHSILYRQYDCYVFRQILNSEVIKKWNRSNPGSSIDEHANLNAPFIYNHLKQHEAHVTQIKHHILRLLHASLAACEERTPKEKNTLLFLGEKFLDTLCPFTWFIISKFQHAPDMGSVLSSIHTSLAQYLNKARIAEYIALVLVELLINEENTNLKKEVQKLFPDLEDAQEALCDEGIRRRIVAELKHNAESLFISWKLQGRSVSTAGTRRKLKITVYGRNDYPQEMRNCLQDAKVVNADTDTLVDYCQQTIDTAKHANLGVYYISYLSEACKEANVRFESSLNRFTRSEFTTVDLSFEF